MEILSVHSSRLAMFLTIPELDPRDADSVQFMSTKKLDSADQMLYQCLFYKTI